LIQVNAAIAAAMDNGYSQFRRIQFQGKT